VSFSTVAELVLCSVISNSHRPTPDTTQPDSQVEPSRVGRCELAASSRTVLPTAILCPPIPTGNNMIPSTDNQLFGTVVEYNCLPGHYVNPNTATQYNYLAIECLETKNWNFTAIPDCARASLRLYVYTFYWSISLHAESRVTQL